MPITNYLKKHTVELLRLFQEERAIRRVPLDLFTRKYCKTHKSSHLKIWFIRKKNNSRQSL